MKTREQQLKENIYFFQNQINDINLQQKTRSFFEKKKEEETKKLNRLKELKKILI